MLLDEEFRVKISSLYEQVTEYNDDKLKSPENEPYKFKYRAKELANEMKAMLINRIERKKSRDSEDGNREEAMLAVVYYILGSIHLDVEELSTGDDLLTEALQLIQNKTTDPSRVLCLVGVLNNLGRLWSGRGDDEKAVTFLDRAEAVYLESPESPTHFNVLFCRDAVDNESGRGLLEKYHTITCFHLARAYKDLKKFEKSACYCHRTLKRQLDSDDFDLVEWALNAATLAQYLSDKNAFKEGRHHLAAANYMIDKEERILEEDTSDRPELIERKELLRNRRCDVNRCWVKYCLMLLSASKDRLMNSEGDRLPPVTKPPDEIVGLFFPSLNVTQYEDQVPCTLPLTFGDAKPIFKFGQDLCQSSLQLYTLAEFASDHTSISLDLSQLYWHLLFFEDDESSQCKMHKRRLDLLAPIADQLNPTYYTNLCRELWLELGGICMAMAEIKSDKLETIGGPSVAKLLKKINCLRQKGIDNYDKFITSFNDSRTGQPPTDYPEEYERAVLNAYLHAASMSGKLSAADKREALEFNMKSLTYYKKIVDYSKDHERVAENFGAELGVCKDMVELLPLKLNKISNQIEF